MVISRSWTLTGSATQSRRGGDRSSGGPFNAPGASWTAAASLPPYAVFASHYGVSFRNGDEIGVQKAAEGFRVWSDLGNHWYEWLSFGDDGTNRPSNRERRLLRVCNIYATKDFTTSGTTAVFDTSGTGDIAECYLGRQVTSLAATDAYAEVDVTGDGDLYVAYTGRTGGTYARVDIDGSQALVNELTDLGAGYKAIDTYTSTDLEHKQVIKVASGLPQGTYTVRVTRKSDSNASSGGTHCFIEAVGITTDLSGATIEPPQWQSGVAITDGEEVQNAGYYYSATGDGTTGATPPTHTSGTTSDGGVTWAAWTRTTWYMVEADLVSTSEREYAVRATIAATDEIGGQTHGRETVQSISFEIDGATWDYANEDEADITTGSRLVITEDIDWTHTDDASLADVSVVRTIEPGYYKIEVNGTIATASVDLGWWYPAMMPAVRWDGHWEEDIFTECRTGSGSVYTIDDAAGSSPTVLEGTEHRAALKGTVDGKTLVIAMNVPTPMDFFFQANISGLASASGTSDWPVKAYFRRATSASPETLTDGQTFAFKSEHVTGVDD